MNFMISDRQALRERYNMMLDSSNTLEGYLKLIRFNNEEFSDEIPEEILHSTVYIDKQEYEPQYKVRNSWFFNNVYCSIDIGFFHGFVNDDIKVKYDEFLSYAKKTKLAKRLTTKEDIIRASEILEMIINDLEKRIGK